MGFFNNFLLRLARKVLESVLGKLVKQMDILENAVRLPVKAIMQEVTGGVWIGKGAEAFVNELSELFMPDVDQSTQLIDGTRTAITKAMGLVDDADQQSFARINDLGDVFKQVF